MAEMERLRATVAVLRRRTHPVVLGLILTATGLLFTFGPQLLGFVGIRVQGPASASATNALRIDTVAANVAAVRLRLATMDSSVKATRDLFTAYVASNCMDPDQARRLREALVPCARLINERGVSPP